MEPIILFLVFLAWRILSSQIEGKARREEERNRREEEEADWQEEVPVRRPNRKIPFEIPTMRQSEPNAETKLPQADRIFIRPKKTEEPSSEPRPKRESRREAKRESGQMSVPTPQAGSVNPLYLERLAMKPTAYKEEVVELFREEVCEEKPLPRIPTSRDRLIEGIILAEVLGKPKAYRDRGRMR